MNLKKEITDNLFVRFAPLSWSYFTGLSTSNLYFTWLVIRKFNIDDVEEEEEEEEEEEG